MINTSGLITDDQGNPIVGATVALFTNDVEIAQLHTDGDGKFHIQLDPKYEGYLLKAKASKAGFEPGQIGFRAGGGHDVDILLKKSPPTPKPPQEPFQHPQQNDQQTEHIHIKKKMALAVVVGVLVVIFAVAGLIAWHFVVKVPDLVGRPTQNAVTTLQDKGLQTEEIESNSPSETAPGVVWKEDPAAGALIIRGSNVKLFLQPARAKLPPKKKGIFGF
jgi:hypothetical protein